MPEPTTFWAAVAATLSTISLALFGVDYYSMLYGFVGALFALAQPESVGRLKAIVFVALSTLVGAAIGNAAVILAGTNSRGLLILGCLIGGAGAQLLVASAIKALSARIEKFGGSS